MLVGRQSARSSGQALPQTEQQVSLSAESHDRTIRDQLDLLVRVVFQDGFDLFEYGQTTGEGCFLRLLDDPARCSPAHPASSRMSCLAR